MTDRIKEESENCGGNEILLKKTREKALPIVESLTPKALSGLMEIAGSETLYDLAMRLAKGIKWAVPSQAAFVLLYHPEKQGMVLAGHRGRTALAPDISVPLGVGAVGQAFLQGKLLRSGNSLTAVPLFMGKSTFGVLCLRYPKVQLSDELWATIGKCVEKIARKCVKASSTWNGVSKDPKPGNPFRRMRLEAMEKKKREDLSNALDDSLGELNGVKQKLECLAKNIAPSKWNEVLVKSEKINHLNNTAEKLRDSKDDKLRPQCIQDMSEVEGEIGSKQQPSIQKVEELLPWIDDALDALERTSRVLQGVATSQNLAMGWMVVERTPVLLTDLVEQVCMTHFQTFMECHKLDLSHLCVGTDKQCFIRCDSEKLMNAIACLIDNALMYTPFGGQPVKISIKCTLERTVILNIRDYGIGIPKDELNKVTDPLFRGSNVPNTPGALGFGCTRAKRIIEFHDGHIVFSNAEPEGTLVQVILPLASIAPTPKKVGNLQLITLEKSHQDLSEDD